MTERRHSSLRWTIYSIFGCFFAIVLINSALSLCGLTRAMNNFDTYRAAEQTHTTALTIDRHVQVLKRHVNQFISTGNASDHKAAHQTYSRLRESIGTLVTTPLDSDVRDAAETMTARLDEYMTQFRLATEERQLRTSLVQETLPRQGEQVHATLKEIETECNRTQLQAQYLATLAAQRSYFIAEQAALKYFAEPRSSFINNTLSALSEAYTTIESLTFPPETRAAELRQLQLEHLDRYKRTCIRAFQATRGYLYLVNVVMAGEAAEFAHYSALLKQTAEQTRLRINDNSQAQTDRIMLITTLGIAAALLAGSVLAVRLVYTVVKPVDALTKTFITLGKGEPVSAIPGTERNDELGELAAAADMFSQKNRQTEELLTQTQSFSQQLSEQAEQLETINAELDSFAYVASHDLKSPLRAIRQLAQWIEEDSSDALSDESIDHLRKLQSRITVMEGLLSDLLEYSRVGRTRTDNETIDSQSMVHELFDMIDNPHQVECAIAPHMPSIETNRVALRQVFLNLLTNAVKHNGRPHGGRIEVRCNEAENWFEFVVSDNGPGIPSKDHDRIFQMYQRVGNTKVDGSGMGLAIIKKQVEVMGGTIRVDSKEGAGAAFTFTWPKPTSEETPQSIQATSSGGSNETDELFHCVG